MFAAIFIWLILFFLAAFTAFFLVFNELEKKTKEAAKKDLKQTFESRYTPKLLIKFPDFCDVEVNQPKLEKKKRVVVSKEVDKLIEQIIEHLSTYYVGVWYRPLAIDNCRTTGYLPFAIYSVDRFETLLNNHIWSFVSTFIDRLYTVNYVNFVGISLTNRLTKHLALLNPQSSDKSTFYVQNKGTNDKMSTSSPEDSQAGKSCDISVASQDQSNEQYSQARSSQKINFVEKEAEAIFKQVKVEEIKHLSSKTVIVSALLQSVRAENTIVYRISTFLVHYLLDNNSDPQLKSSFLKSRYIRLLMTDCMAGVFHLILERISDPSFINYEIIKFLKKHIIEKNLVFIEGLDKYSRALFNDIRVDYSPSLKLNTDLRMFSLNDMKLCINEHNFNKLFELIGQCEDIECLRNIRLFIISEILDAAVINYLNKNNELSRLAKQFLNEEIRSVSSSAKLKLTNDGEKLGIGFKGLRFVKTSARQHYFEGGNGEEKVFDSTKHFNFNANINSKVKKLKTKDMRRYINQLNYAKTLCEQNIHSFRRYEAALLPSPSNEKVISSLDESRFNFDLSYSSDLVRSFDESCLPNIGMFSSPGNSIFTAKPKNKRIFSFTTIMANKYSRNYFKKFLHNSLFSRENRSSLSKYRKDELISDCAVYLVEFWETIQSVFSNFVAHFGPVNTGTSDRTLASIYADSYLIVMNIIADPRFFYTFSDQFLQLPSDLTKQLENFLIGDISLAEFKMNDASLDFDLGNLSKLFTFDPVLSERCLNRINFDIYLDVFLVLERVVFKCLENEFYAQFLISSEYDEMLSNVTQQLTQSPNTEEVRTLVDLKKSIPSAIWSNIVDKKEDGSTRESIPTRPIQKITLEGNPIDISKNRLILLNSLEFPFFGLLSMLMQCQYRLLIKLNIKSVIAQNEATLVLTGENCSSIPLDIEQLVTRDIVYYNNIHSRLHIMVTNVFCWLNSEFSCSVHDVVYHAQENLSSTNTGADKLISFVENIFVDPATDSAQQCQIHFKIHVTTKPAAGAPQSLLNSMARDWSNSWTIEQSLEEINRFHQQLLPISRLVSYLFHYRLDDYLWVLLPTLLGDGSNYPNLGMTPDRLLKHTNRYLIGIRQQLRLELRDRMKQDKNKLKIEQLSFRKLLDNESATTSFIETSDGSAAQNTSIYIKEIQHNLERTLAQLTSTPYVSRLRLFLYLVKYNAKVDSKTSCLRCELIEHVFNDCNIGNESMSRFMIEILYSLSLRSIADFENDFLGGSSEKNKTNFSNSPSLSSSKLANNFQQASKMFQKTRAVPLLEPDRSAKLFVLHAHSWLSEKSSFEILDYVCSTFRYFDRFCANCLDEMTTREMNRLATGNVTYKSASKRAGSFRGNKFRLFNIDTSNCGGKGDGRSTSATSTSSKAMGVIVNSNNSTSSNSCLLEQNNIGSSMFDAFSIEKFDLLSTSISETDSNLIEPLFQFIVDAFELKGTMIKSLRRTLMFAFQLTFGQIMLSKQMKTVLENFFADSSIVSYLNSLDAQFDLKLDESKSCEAASPKTITTRKKRKSKRKTSKPTQLNDISIQDLPTFIDQINNEKNLEKVKQSKAVEKIDKSFPSTSLESKNVVNIEPKADILFNTPVETKDKKKEEHLQLLAKQLLFASVPTFMNHLFGHEATLVGLNKCFDILQNQQLNKQLTYEFIEAFLQEYFPELKKL